jgi:cysteine synthase
VLCSSILEAIGNTPLVELRNASANPRVRIFAGVSSGAVLHAAQRVAEQMEAGRIVALLADGGWKYLSLPLDQGL